MQCNRNEMASILGVAPATLDLKIKDGLPGKKEGKEWVFDTKKVLDWLIKEATKGSQGSKKSSAELRITLADAELKEFKVAEARKTMVHVDDIAPIVEEQLSIVKSKITALPARVVQKVAVEEDPAVCLRILKDEVADVLEEISKDDVPDPQADLRKHGFRWDEDPEETEPELTDDGY